MTSRAEDSTFTKTHILRAGAEYEKNGNRERLILSVPVCAVPDGPDHFIAYTRSGERLRVSASALEAAAAP